MRGVGRLARDGAGRAVRRTCACGGPPAAKADDARRTPASTASPAGSVLTALRPNSGAGGKPSEVEKLLDSAHALMPSSVFRHRRPPDRHHPLQERRHRPAEAVTDERRSLDDVQKLTDRFIAEIDKVSAICEIIGVGMPVVPDMSLGTHFFNDLVEANMLYLAVHPPRRGNAPRNRFSPTVISENRSSPAGNEMRIRAERANTGASTSALSHEMSKKYLPPTTSAAGQAILAAMEEVEPTDAQLQAA